VRTEHQQIPYELENRRVFNDDRKMFTEDEERINSGMIFHTGVAAEVKAQLTIAACGTRMYGVLFHHMSTLYTVIGSANVRLCPFLLQNDGQNVQLVA